MLDLPVLQMVDVLNDVLDVLLMGLRLRFRRVEVGEIHMRVEVELFSCRVESGGMDSL